MAAKIMYISHQQTKPIKISKWKVREGSSVSIGRLLVLYNVVGDQRQEQRKLKSTLAGIVHKIVAQEGECVKQGGIILELQACSHPTIMIDMCAECGADLRKNDVTSSASVPMIHAIPDLKVSEELAQKLGKADNERLIKDKKLVLLVDLDQTLIHTTNDNIPPNIKDVYHFQLNGPQSPWYHTRLRPGTHSFLNNIHDFYELHICTFGSRNYAHTIAMFLDADQKIFSNRILSRDECFDPTSKKANLKALFPCGDNLVCIIDDREDVWSHATNLIHVKPYHFFQHTGDINAPPGLDKHENDLHGGVDLTKIKKKVNGQAKSDMNCKIDEKLNENDTSKNVQSLEKSIKQNDENMKAVSNDSKDENSNSPEVKSCSTTESEKHLCDNVLSKTESEDNIAGKALAEGMTAKSADETLNNTNDVRNGPTESGNPKETIDNEVQVTENNDELEKPVEDDEETPEKKINENGISENSENGISEKSENGITEKSENGIKTDSKESHKEKIDEKPCESESDEKNSSDEKAKTKDILIEIEDPDDYLIYLEEVLKRIHKQFFDEFDLMESGEVPDMKKVIPSVRSKILEGCRLVFSGLVPTHIKLVQSKAYQVARSLGAVVTPDIDDDTTHLVAVRPGTAKVNAGRRKKHLKIVTPDWLWCCAERWEHVDERIFPLNRKGSKNRHPPPHCSSPEHVTSYPEHNAPASRKRTPSGRFMDTINPLMSFSSDDIADMDKEVEDILDNDSDSSEDETKKNPIEEHIETAELITRSSSSSSEDSLTGEYPKGYKRKREEENNLLEEYNSTEDDEFPSVKFRRGENVDDVLDFEQDDTQGSVDPPDEVDDGEWNMMGAALEREFLANN
ncbi:hypothetical protein JTB14_009197 [Gonioctena quinquepunctata]|nr:hypothetical protein JTB14_009197 [Gonioctena quinquepunctata]